MRTTNEKAVEYLKSNPIVAKFIQKLDNERKEYYEKAATIKRWIDELTILFEKRKEKVNNI